METVYCGGRFHFDYQNEDYLQKASDDYRAILLGDVNTLLRGSGIVKINDTYSYIGPYYFESDGMVDKEIVQIEMRMIEDSTLDVFLLEDGLCPGTVSEMVYASTLHKQMIVVYIQDDRETESNLKCPCWYPIIHCLQINEGNIRVIAARDFFHAQRIILNILHGIA